MKAVFSIMAGAAIAAILAVSLVLLTDPPLWLCAVVGAAFFQAGCYAGLLFAEKKGWI